MAVTPIAVTRHPSGWNFASATGGIVNTATAVTLKASGTGTQTPTPRFTREEPTAMKRQVQKCAASRERMSPASEALLRMLRARRHSLRLVWSPCFYGDFQFRAPAIQGTAEGRNRTLGFLHKGAARRLILQQSHLHDATAAGFTSWSLAYQRFRIDFLRHASL